jgi:integrase/recombinase XerD
MWLRARAEHRSGIDCSAIFTTFSPAGLSPRAKPLSRFGAYQRVRYYAGLEGLGHIKPHDFRRFVGTQLTAKLGLRAAQLALGHSSPETTAQHYVFDRLEAGMTEELY